MVIGRTTDDGRTTCPYGRRQPGRGGIGQFADEEVHQQVVVPGAVGAALVGRA